MTLPKGPWRSSNGSVFDNQGDPIHGPNVIAVANFAMSTEDRDELARAICALPDLIDAAREIVSLSVPAEMKYRLFDDLEAALRIVDGRSGDI